MRTRYWLLIGFLGAYALAWAAAWLRLRTTGHRDWIAGLQRVLAAVGRANARIVLTLLYLLVLPFFAVFFIARDTLDLRAARRDSYWKLLARVPATPERYQHPF